MVAARRSRTPEEVFADHTQLLSGGNLDAVIENYAEDAVFVTKDAVRRGREGVREGLELLANDMPGAEWTLSPHFGGDVLLLVWTARGSQTQIGDGVDTFVFKDGRIIAQTVSYTVEASG